MHARDAWRWLMAVIFAALLPFGAIAADTSTAKAQVQRQADQPGNNAPVWRDVRSGENPYQTTQVRGPETSVLIQSQGETWRQLRNGPITIYGGWLLVAVVALLALFYWRKGKIMLKEKPTGRMMVRFNYFERVVHWSAAISFCVLAVSGLVILFGKYVLLPVFGYTLFSWLAILSKSVHNFVGPLFTVCVLVMFFTFVKDNLPSARDIGWLLKGGGLFTGEHVPSSRFNAGEKSWFWFGVTALGIVSSATGFILDFPNFAQSRELMQQANVIHAVSAVVFMAMSLGHIYLGTIGMEGAYESMRDGVVDEVWAKEHHEYWYEEEKARLASGGAPSAAAASSMKEGWKL